MDKSGVGVKPAIIYSQQAEDRDVQHWDVFGGKREKSPDSEGHRGIVFCALPCVAVAAEDARSGSVRELANNCVIERLP
jgi:hypothetical protein